MAELATIADVPYKPQSEAIQPSTIRVNRLWRFNHVGTVQKVLRSLRQIRPDGVIYNVQMASFGDREIPAALGLMAPMLSRLVGYLLVRLQLRRRWVEINAKPSLGLRADRGRPRLVFGSLGTFAEWRSIGRRGTPSVSVSWAAPFQFLPDLRLHGLWRSVREFRDGDYGGVSQGLRG